ncbi:hypothetical protein KEJ44_08975 [Candidatus Bathyarchaeota archaeon]|nr:hypothetical protein [Candidatus Bathyarchaeota archaeon]
MAPQNPHQALRRALYEILDAALDVEVYRDGIPRLGAKIPSVSITYVGGSGAGLGMGRWIAADTQGEALTLRVQLDLFHSSQAGLDRLADQIYTALFDGYALLFAAGVLAYRPIVSMDVPPEEQMSRGEYRKIIDYEFVVEVG